MYNRLEAPRKLLWAQWWDVKTFCMKTWRTCISSARSHLPQTLLLRWAEARCRGKSVSSSEPCDHWNKFICHRRFLSHGFKHIEIITLPFRTLMWMCTLCVHSQTVWLNEKWGFKRQKSQRNIPRHSGQENQLSWRIWRSREASSSDGSA